MNEKLLDILKPQGECIGEDTLIRYAKGELPAEEARRVEEHLTECELCSDALDGIMKSGDVVHYRAKVSHAKRSLQHKLRGTEERSMFPFTRALAIAATVMLLVVSAWFVQYLMNNESQKIFSDQFKPYPVTKGDTIIHEQLPPAINETITSAPAAPASEKKLTTPAEKKTELRNTADSVSVSVSSAANERSISAEEKNVEAVPQPEVALSDNDLSQKEAVKHQPQPNAASNFSAEPRAGVAEKMIVSDSVSLSEKDISKQFIDDHLNRAIDYYQDAKYSDALAEFQLVLEKDPSNPTANFYSGVSALALNNADEALSFFKKTDDKNNRYYEATLWYEALAYLKKDQKKEAKNLLEKVAKQNGEHQSQAEELLKGM